MPLKEQLSAAHAGAVIPIQAGRQAATRAGRRVRFWDGNVPRANPERCERRLRASESRGRFGTGFAAPVA